VGLAAKGALLGLLALLFIALSVTVLLDRPWPLLVRLVAAAAFAFPLPVLGPGAFAALSDALTGRAVRVEGAVALASRRAGWSLRLPSGLFAEYLLWNPWLPLTPSRTYTVVHGERSRVLVEPPREEQVDRLWDAPS